MPTATTTRAGHDREETQQQQRCCRICLEGPAEEEPLVSPCNCRGFSRYVHASCISQWQRAQLQQQGGASRASRCDICSTEYQGLPAPPRRAAVDAAKEHIAQWFQTVAALSGWLTGSLHRSIPLAVWLAWSCWGCSTWSQLCAYASCHLVCSCVLLNLLHLFLVYKGMRLGVLVNGALSLILHGNLMAPHSVGMSFCVNGLIDGIQVSRSTA
jgi:hypothetical protein